MAANPARRHYITYFLLGILVVGLLIAVIVLAATRPSGDEPDNKPSETEGQTGEPCPGPADRAVDFLKWSGLSDGLDVTWNTVINEGEARNIDKDTYQLIEVIPDTSTSLLEILQILTTTKSAIKTIASENVTETMRMVDESGFDNPAFVTLSVRFEDEHVNRQIVDVQSYNASGKFILNFDMTECCQDFIGYGLTEYIDDLVASLDYSSSIEVNAEVLVSSETWDNLRWLLEKNRNMLLIVTLKTTTTTNDDLVYDILRARNDMPENKILYNLDGLGDSFKATANTGGSPLHRFDIASRDAGKIIWSHNTDTWDQLHDAIQGDVMMIEGDIMLFGQNTTSQNNTPIMAHNYGDFNNITFEQWLDEILTTEKGMKFDFKSIDAVKPALVITNARKDRIKVPIWLNADIMQGPGAGSPRIPYERFLNDTEAFPAATLSLGWTTVRKGSNYDLALSMDMVSEMHDICKNLRQPVTFPARAEQLVDSWPALSWLLKQSRGYTLTVWTSDGDNVTRADMVYIKQRCEKSRVYFDLPEDLRP